MRPSSQLKRVKKHHLDYFQPISIGDKVTIVRFGEKTPPYIEGVAIVKHLARMPDTYNVMFVNEQTLHRRLVFRQFQHDPERLIAMLRAIWRAEDAGYHLSDFFPDTSSWPEV